MIWIVNMEEDVLIRCPYCAELDDVWRSQLKDGSLFVCPACANISALGESGVPELMSEKYWNELEAEQKGKAILLRAQVQERIRK